MHRIRLAGSQMAKKTQNGPPTDEAFMVMGPAGAGSTIRQRKLLRSKAEKGQKDV